MIGIPTKELVEIVATEEDKKVGLLALIMLCNREGQEKAFKMVRQTRKTNEIFNKPNKCVCIMLS